MPDFHVRYYLDRVTGRPHIEEHWVSQEEVEEVLNDSAEDRIGRKGSRVAIGQTNAGRYELSGKPLRAFRRRQTKRR